VQVGTAASWKAVSSGERHSAAIQLDGSLWTWGANGSGQLGDGTLSGRSSPVRIGGLLSTWTAVSVGAFHTVAVRSDGTLWTWG
jgi:alpha-tubulin suppressor-like RCC1 family protein